jgi:sn-glycerol 3-phosphate transport system substrate-binding protein
MTDTDLGAPADGPVMGRRVLSRRDLLRGATVAGLGTGIALLIPGAAGAARSRFPIGAAAKAASKPVSVTMWHSMTSANLTALTTLTDQFNASQKDVVVNLVGQTSYTDTLTAYTTALSGQVSRLPDIVQWETELIQILIDSQTVVSAASAIAADHYSLRDFVPSMINYFRVDGTLWALPFNVSSQVLYYDQNAFTKAGLDPTTPPTSLAQLRSAAQKIVSSGTAKYGMSLKETASTFELWMALGGVTMVNKQNGRAGRATAVTFDDALGKSIFNWWAAMLNDHLAQATSGTSYDNLLAIGSGIAPMTLDTSASLGTILEVLNGGQYANIKLGVGPIPSPSSKPVKTGGIFIGGAGLYMVKKSAATQDASWQFIKYLTEPAQQAAWAAASGYVPVRKSATSLAPLVQTWAKVPGYRVPYEQLLKSPSNAATAGYVAGSANEIDQSILNALESLASGTSPTQAIASASSAANAAISSYNERV